MTDHEGRYRFPKVFPRMWAIIAKNASSGASGYDYIEAGCSEVKDVVLPYNRKVVINTVFHLATGERSSVAAFKM